MRVTGMVTLIAILLWAAFWGTVIGVAVHFISKFW